MSPRLCWLSGWMGGAILLSGCGARSPAPSSSGYDYGNYGFGAAEITFLDDAPANISVDEHVGFSDLTFTSPDGRQQKVRDHLGAHGAVVVITRGATDPICPYCSTQTAGYIRDYEQFRQRGVEVLLVYPLETRQQESRLEAFLTNARGRLAQPQQSVPFPVVFDVELSAVNQLGIRQDLSKPATFIVDARGVVRYAYVGAHLADRPSTAAVLRELDKLATETTAAANQPES